MQIPDQHIREQALTPDQSFLVQAPAGSGKTELLTQRLLVLLSQVEKIPEEIIAITFTKKAAAEMRERVIKALMNAKNHPEPEAGHAKQTWYLAKAVLKRDEQCQWHLLDNSQRLNITTIDSLCASITQRMPVLSRFGAQPMVIKDAKPLYQKAVARLLNDLESKQTWQPSLKIVLQHLDNRFDNIEKLLLEMLTRRDQWLDVVQDARHHHALKEVLESAFERVAEVYLQRVQSHFPAQWLDTLLVLMAFSERHRVEPSSLSIEFWQSAANMLLTKKGVFRKDKAVNKQVGFPNPKTASSSAEQAIWQHHKQLAITLLSELRQIVGLEMVLSDIQKVPHPQFMPQQWQVLEALLAILPVLAAHLKVVFQQESQVDFAEVALSALHALGEHDQPSDVALILDHQIRHFLVDEFQDTSQLQFRLLEKLTLGWQAGDGRTLFCVGDPMQSIYRFRQADVSLFLKAKQQGVGEIPLQFLRLEMNFRSDKTIINWVNRVFPDVFPSEDNVVNGAVGYSPSVAMREASGLEDSIVWHFECDDLIQAIADIRQEESSGTIAILVRSRSHLSVILPALRQRQIPYQAIGIETLDDRQVIRDLMSLTFALQHTADTLSWLAVLRAPWAGLGLKDLTVLNASGSPVLQACTIAMPALSGDAQAIIARVFPILEQGLLNRDRLSVADNVYQVWLALSGPACLSQSQDIDNAECYFDLLRNITKQGRLPSREMLLQYLEGLNAKATVTDANPVQIMTIHNAKGLEFDTVIIPGLQKRNKPSNSPILIWEPYRLRDDSQDILMAPIKSRADESGAMYQFLRQREKQKEHFEMQRLLYVAVTRAKHRLILGAEVQWDEKKDRAEPLAQSSLLGLLWHDAQSHYKQNVTDISQEKICHSPKSSLNQVVCGQGSVLFLNDNNQLFRLPINTSDTFRTQTQLHIEDNKNMPTPPAFKPQIPAIVGTIIHQYLAKISKNVSQWTSSQVTKLQSNIRKTLQQQGIFEESVLNLGYEKILQALQKCLADQQGQWILSDHQQAQSEFVLQHNIDENNSTLYTPTATLVIDRTFIDEKGIRWIIDYKTSEPDEGESLTVFLARELKNYQPQLMRYSEVFKQLESDRSVQCALYFVMLPHLQEIR